MSSGKDDIKTPDSFFFRLNKDNQFYYTASDKDTVVLGALRLALFIPNPTENTGCFEVF